MQEQLEIVKNRFEKDKYSKRLGIVLDELTDDTIQMHMQLREDMNNWFGQLHGGAVYASQMPHFQYWRIIVAILQLPWNVR